MATNPRSCLLQGAVQEPCSLSWDYAAFQALTSIDCSPFMLSSSFQWFFSTHLLIAAGEKPRFGSTRQGGFSFLTSVLLEKLFPSVMLPKSVLS